MQNYDEILRSKVLPNDEMNNRNEAYKQLGGPSTMEVGEHRLAVSSSESSHRPQPPNTNNN